MVCTHTRRVPNGVVAFKPGAHSARVYVRVRTATPAPVHPDRRVDLYFFRSGCRDSNPGPSVPQTDALTKLRHSP